MLQAADVKQNVALVATLEDLVLDTCSKSYLFSVIKNYPCTYKNSICIKEASSVEVCFCNFLKKFLFKFDV
jgi:hypothetical protein